MMYSRGVQPEASRRPGGVFHDDSRDRRSVCLTVADWKSTLGAPDWAASCAEQARRAAARNRPAIGNLDGTGCATFRRIGANHMARQIPHAVTHGSVRAIIPKENAGPSASILSGRSIYRPEARPSWWLSMMLWASRRKRLCAM